MTAPTIHCPNCQTTAAPARRWTGESTLHLLWPPIMIVGTLWGLGNAEVPLVSQAHAIALVGVFALAIVGGIACAIAARAPVCRACGWRHVRAATAAECAAAPQPQ
jgi:hypothetical protein